MGGYNTVCEILSFDKPALIVPRIVPREEQLIRASRASELGLFDMLLPEDAEDPKKMAQALKDLLNRAPPSANGRNLKLDGLENLSRRVAEWLQPDDTVKVLTPSA
jgi:predicted glycosyltransferase